MVVSIKKGMSRNQVRKMVKDALEKNWKQKKEKKSKSLKKIGGLLSRLKMSPMEIQKEMRDGWL